MAVGATVGSLVAVFVGSGVAVWLGRAVAVGAAVGSDVAVVVTVGSGVAVGAMVAVGGGDTTVGGAGAEVVAVRGAAGAMVAVDAAVMAGGWMAGADVGAATTTPAVGGCAIVAVGAASAGVFGGVVADGSSSPPQAARRTTISSDVAAYAGIRPIPPIGLRNRISVLPTVPVAGHLTGIRIVSWTASPRVQPVSIVRVVSTCYGVMRLPASRASTSNRSDPTRQWNGSPFVVESDQRFLVVWSVQ